jgi:hypothetical protein
VLTGLFPVLLQNFDSLGEHLFLGALLDSVQILRRHLVAIRTASHKSCAD